MADPVVDVCIVSYRCEGLLRNCLQALVEGHGSVTVHVVDNASHDGTAEMVRQEFPEVGLTENPRNYGFARAVNIALRGGTSPYVLVLNPDTEVQPDAVQCLVDVLAARSDLAVSGPRLELEDGSLDHASRRSFPTPLNALGHFTRLARRRGGSALGGYEVTEVEEGPVDAVCGACMMIRREALDEVGVFD